jgi:NADPH:quinone reductase-like Zn-dependent oxidoreductase
MRAAVYTRYGPPDVIQITEVETPAPKDNEVLIKVHAASVNPLDGALMKARPHSLRILLGLRKPKDTRPGRDVAGEVRAVGRNVTRFKPGEEVFGLCLRDPQDSGAGVWAHCHGAFAEYTCAPEATSVLKPDGVTFEQAAAVPVAALTALQGLRDQGQIQPGHKVLIHGAGGGVGTFAVQIAKWLGADVTGVTRTGNLDMVRSIGADRVIDYTQEDFTQSGQSYDLIFDCFANHSLSACRRVLNPKGIYVMAGGPGSRWMVGILAPVIKALVLSPFVSQKLVTFLARPNTEDLTTVHELMKTGKVTPVIDRCYRLNEVAEAIRHLEGGQARGKVVITLENNHQVQNKPSRDSARLRFS